MSSRSVEFNIAHETRRTVVDLMRGGEPTTILGLLLANSQGIGTEEIAERLGTTASLVSWDIDKLEREDLCVRVEVDGATKVLPLATYTSRNT